MAVQEWREFDAFTDVAEIRRTGEVAEIIVDYVSGKPVRLIGFQCDAALTDFEIIEEGHRYLCEFLDELEKIR